MQRAILPFALVAALLCAADAARAGDGRIEISQTCAVQTGCEPGDAPGFPVRVTSNKSYVLTSDLDVPTQGVSAIDALGSDITIDLNGFSITGTYPCATFPPNCISDAPANGIDARDSNGMIVRNGTIQRFDGAAVSVGLLSHVEGLLVEVCGGAGILARSGSIVANNRISNIGADGIRIDFNDAQLGDGRVTGNTIRSVRGDGIEMDSGIVTENYVTNGFDADGRFGGRTGFGRNRFDSLPVGGRSLGDNVCNTSLC